MRLVYFGVYDLVAKLACLGGAMARIPSSSCSPLSSCRRQDLGHNTAYLILKTTPDWFSKAGTAESTQITGLVMMKLCYIDL